MKKSVGIFFFLLSFLSCSFLFGQRIVAELEMKGGKAQSVYSASDRLGNMAYILQGSKSFQITILNDSTKVVAEYLINRVDAEKKNEIIGAVFDNNYVVIYLYDDKDRKFASLLVNRFTGEFKYNQFLGELKKGEHLLKTLEMEGAFYVLVVPHQKNTIILLSSTEGNAFTIKNYEVNFPTLYAKLSTKNDELNQSKNATVGIEHINYTIENNIKSSYPSKKMYTYGDRIYMTFEEPAHTHLIIIDPDSANAVYRKLNFTLDKEKGATPRQGNSFLFKGDLFRVTMNENQMNLIVVSLDSMQMLESYNMFPDQPISFINGFIREDGSGKEEKIIKNTQQFFRRVQKGKLAVAVNELTDGNYVTEVGGYEEVKVYRNSSPGGYYSPMSSGLSIGLGLGMGSMGMGGMGMGGFGMGMGGMGMGMGGFGYPGYYPSNNYGYNSTSIYVTYFQSLMRVQDLSHVEGKVPQTIREKMNDYESDVFKNSSPELLNIAPTNNGLILGYYLKGRSRYNLVEFKR